MDIYPFEFIGAKKLYEEERFLLADEMGMFKTAQSIFANNKMRKGKKKFPTLVISPTSVKEHWEREIIKWAYPRKQEITIVSARNYDAALRRVRDSDWVIINYSLASRMDDERTEHFLKEGFRHVIIDEVHNAKNPEAIRTRVIKRAADRAEYLSALSGTPVPNTMEDIYMLMSLLDPEKYPFEISDHGANAAKEARRRFLDLYWQNPQAVKNLLHRKMLRRELAEYLTKKVPHLEEETVQLELSGKQLEIYNAILEQKLSPGKKIMQLEKILLDPKLVDRELLDNQNVSEGIRSCKYVELDGIVERETRRGKVLVFTNLKTNVVKNLEMRYSKFGAIAIDGDVSTEIHGPREHLRERFQKDRDVRVLIATTTMNEGVDLTAATAIVDLTVPWTPAEHLQRIKRSQRIGEIEKDRVKRYTLVATLPQFISLDQAMLDMLAGKEQNINYMLSGIKLSREELLEMQEPKRSPRIKRAIRAPNQTIFGYYVNWRGIGSEASRRRLKRKNSTAQMIADLYPNFSMAYNAARLYIPLIEKRQCFYVLDLASGPGMYSYFSKRPSIAIDLDINMLKKGEDVSASADKINGMMHAIPLQDEMVNGVVCSLAYQMTEPKEERAKALQEMNRVLTKGGYVFLVLPGNYMSAADMKKFESAIQAYGFKIDYRNFGQGPSKLDVYVLKKLTDSDDGIRNLRLKGDYHEK